MPEKGVEFKGGILHDGFGCFEGLGGSGGQLTLLFSCATNAGRRPTMTVMTLLAASEAMAVLVMTATPLELNLPWRQPENRNSLSLSIARG